MLRQRNVEQIRTDAIKVGIQKAKNGCISCAESYFECAKQHGATEEQICQALETATKTTGKRLSRRDLIKIAAAGSLALSMGGLFTKNAQAISTWWGTDSNTGTCCGLPQDIYIGRIGYGVESGGDPYFFNRDAASNAGYSRTYGYWGVVGPDDRPPKKSPYTWGQNQAGYAWSAHNNGPNSDLLGGLTIFGDIEPGFGGWSSGNYGQNQDVINGFLAELFAITPPQVWPGLYISPYYWSDLLGQNFTPGTDFVLWLTGCDTCGSDICSPCDPSCNTITTVQNRLASTVVGIGLGGRQPVLWQYWLDPPCGCGDFNVTTQYTASFTPVTGGTTYSSC